MVDWILVKNDQTLVQIGKPAIVELDLAGGGFSTLGMFTYKET